MTDHNLTSEREIQHAAIQERKAAFYRLHHKQGRVEAMKAVARDPYILKFYGKLSDDLDDVACELDNECPSLSHNDVACTDTCKIVRA